MISSSVEFSSPYKSGGSDERLAAAIRANEDLSRRLAVAEEHAAQLKIDLEESYTSKFETELALKNTISHLSAKVTNPSYPFLSIPSN